MATIADLMVRIGVDTDDLESGMKSATDSIDRNFGKITAAGVAAGAGMEGFARKQQTANVQISQLASSTGMGQDAMRSLAEETSNVTFPLEDVLDLMETGRQRGLESADELQRYAQFWDRVGDATGESATELGKSGAALAAVGVEAGNEEEAIAALGFVHQETTSSVKEFNDFLAKTGPELREMGADVDDTAAILGVMERELGLTGREARTEFRQAVNESEGDLSSLLDTLGISEQSFDSMRQTVEGSTGVIDRNAEAFAESFTPLQRMTHAAEELMFKYGGLAEAAGMLAIPLLALGPLLKIVSFGFTGIVAVGKVLITGLGAVGKAFMILSKILLTNPWVLVAAAVIALVVVIVKNWDTIVSAISAAWDWISSTAKKVWNWLTGFIGGIVSGIAGKVSSGFNTVVGFFRKLPGRAMSAISGLLGRVTRFFGSIPGKILSALGNLGSLLFNAGKNIISGLIDGVKSMFGSVKDAVGNVISGARDLLPFSPAKEGPLAVHPPDEAGTAIGRMLAEGLLATESDVVKAAEGVARAAAVQDPAAPADPLSARGATAAAPQGGQQRLVLDVTGADEEMKRLIRKLVRTDDLLQEDEVGV